MIGIKEFEKKQLVFLFARQGEKLSFSNDNIIVKDRDGLIKHQSTCYRIFALFIIGNCTITTGLIQRAKKFCFPIVLMTGNMRVYDVLGFQADGNTQLRSLQYNCPSNRSLEIARLITENKILNQKETLQRQRKRSEKANEVIAFLGKEAKEAHEANSLQTLMGMEGSSARHYFSVQFNNCKWKGRKPRAKQDYVNATLDIGYTLLFNFIESLLRLYGFDLYVGILHQQFYMRKSLVCDLVEPFRPLIDYRVRKAINLRQCKEDDFVVCNGAYILKHEENKRYTLFLSEPLLENKVEIFEYIRQFYRAFGRNMPINDFPMFRLA